MDEGGYSQCVRRTKSGTDNSPLNIAGMSSLKKRGQPPFSSVSEGHGNRGANNAIRPDLAMNGLAIQRCEHIGRHVQRLSVKRSPDVRKMCPPPRRFFGTGTYLTTIQLSLFCREVQPDGDGRRRGVGLEIARVEWARETGWIGVGRGTRGGEKRGVRLESDGLPTGFSHPWQYRFLGAKM